VLIRRERLIDSEAATSSGGDETVEAVHRFSDVPQRIQRSGCSSREQMVTKCGVTCHKTDKYCAVRGAEVMPSCLIGDSINNCKQGPH